MTEQIIREIKEDQDSLEIGKVSSGKIKVYGDFRKEEDFKQRVECAIKCMIHAQTEMSK